MGVQHLPICTTNPVLACLVTLTKKIFKTHVEVWNSKFRVVMFISESNYNKSLT